MIRGFISYSTIDRIRAAEIKSSLHPIGVECFMAHDDIKVSEEWRQRILQELREARVFVALLSAAFKRSEWASQEIGVAVSQANTLIIPVSLDQTVPYGFISHLQGRPLPQPVEAAFFRDAIATKFPREIISQLIGELAKSSAYRTAEARFRALLPFLDKLTAEEANRLAKVSTDNGQIWDAGECATEYLPLFIEKNRDKIRPELLTPLAYQIEHNQWYNAEEKT